MTGAAKVTRRMPKREREYLAACQALPLYVHVDGSERTVVERLCDMPADKAERMRAGGYIAQVHYCAPDGELVGGKYARTVDELDVYSRLTPEQFTASMRREFPMRAARS